MGPITSLIFPLVRYFSDYERTGTDPSHCERVFCRPADALCAGWQQAKRKVRPTGEKSLV